MMGETGQHPLEDLMVEPFKRQPAAPFMRDREHAVDIGKLLLPTAVTKPIGDIPRGAGRTVDRADHGDIVSRPDPTVRPRIAAKRPEPLRLRRLRPLGGKGIVALEQVGFQIMDVDVRASGDRLRREADDLPVLAHRLAHGDVGQGDLVPQTDRVANLDRRPIQLQDKPTRNRPGRHRHVVVALEDDGLGFRDRYRHARPLCPERDSSIQRYQMVSVVVCAAVGKPLEVDLALTI